MRRWLVAGAAVVVVAGLLVWSAAAFGLHSLEFAFLVCWLPMTGLGLVSRTLTVRLPAGYHQLRGWERSGRVYERSGVLVAKGLLRRGPLAVFNPDLHLPAERTPQQLARLAQRMRDAEASHATLLVAMLAVIVADAARGWWDSAGWVLLFDLLMNGYPVMLQRYNRARLAQRFGVSE